MFLSLKISFGDGQNEDDAQNEILRSATDKRRGHKDRNNICNEGYSRVNGLAMFEDMKVVQLAEEG